MATKDTEAEEDTFSDFGDYYPVDGYPLLQFEKDLCLLLADPKESLYIKKKITEWMIDEVKVVFTRKVESIRIADEETEFVTKRLQRLELEREQQLKDDLERRTLLDGSERYIDELRCNAKYANQELEREIEKKDEEWEKKRRNFIAYDYARRCYNARQTRIKRQASRDLNESQKRIQVLHDFIAKIAETSMKAEFNKKRSDPLEVRAKQYFAVDESTSLRNIYYNDELMHKVILGTKSKLYRKLRRRREKALIGPRLKEAKEQEWKEKCEKMKKFHDIWMSDAYAPAELPKLTIDDLPFDPDAPIHEVIKVLEAGVDEKVDKVGKRQYLLKMLCLWHPDKFCGKFMGRITKKLEDPVKNVMTLGSKALTKLMSDAK